MGDPPEMIGRIAVWGAPTGAAGAGNSVSLTVPRPLAILAFDLAFGSAVRAGGGGSPMIAPAAHVFEIRRYTTPPGKLEALKARFRDHTMALFKKHGLHVIGYWVPQDPPLSENTLIYVLAHDSREAARTRWAAFAADPDWITVKANSEKDGPLTVKPAESMFADPTDFSPLQ